MKNKIIKENQMMSDTPLPELSQCNDETSTWNNNNNNKNSNDDSNNIHMMHTNQINMFKQQMHNQIFLIF